MRGKSIALQEWSNNQARGFAVRYLNVALMSKGYVGETGKSGARLSKATWSGIETKLKTAIVDLNNAINMPSNTAVSNKPASGKINPNIQNRVKQFEAFSAPSNEQERRNLIKDAGKRVSHYREWLRREGASADNQGVVEMSAMDKLKVYYDQTASDQGLSQLHVQNGHLMIAEGNRMVRFDTKKMVTHFSGPGKCIYVMSMSGKIHVGSHVVGHYHHSSLLAGAPVACAGELEAKDGKLTWISNKSGHYQPQVPHLVQVIHQLKKMGFAPGTYSLTRRFGLNGKQIKQYPSAMSFLADLDNLGEDDYEVSKLLAYSKHLTNTILATNNWRWRTSQAEDVGVYDQTTNKKVSHKVVRRWLKQQGYQADETKYRDGVVS